jgi:amino acid transporter
MGPAGVMPSFLDRVNAAGAPRAASVASSVVTGAVIALFAYQELDAVVNMFFWFSGLAVVAIVLVEALVCVAIIAYFRREPEGAGIWSTLLAPALAFVGLVLGLYLLMSRFGLLAGTVAEGVDPTTQAWGLNTTGWVLVLLPFAMLALGTLVGLVRRDRENEDAVKDLVT